MKGGIRANGEEKSQEEEEGSEEGRQEALRPSPVTKKGATVAPFFTYPGNLVVTLGRSLRSHSKRGCV